MSTCPAGTHQNSAQHEVLGEVAKRRVRPARDDRNARLFGHTQFRERRQRSIVPSGTGSLLKRQPSTSYWAAIKRPPGPDFLTYHFPG
jgi:hypothetical protein